MTIKLNLGCGRDVREGWVNVDKHPCEGVDLVLDLDKDPLPFPDGSVDEVYASHVLEHLLKWEELVIEVHRVLKPRSRFEIIVPYGYRWNSAYHVRYFLPLTMDDFCLTDKLDWTEKLHSHDFPLDPSSYSVSLQARPLFVKVKQHLHYKMLGAWHHVPLGRRYTIHWVLEKVGS